MGPDNAVQQTTDMQIGGTEEGSCENTKKILYNTGVVSLIFDYYYVLIFIGIHLVFALIIQLCI